MVPGHTKFKCDGSFGLIKRLYRKTAVDCVDHIVDVVKRSSIAGLNKARCYNGSEGFQYFDIISGLETYFRKLPGLQKFQHFLFTSANSGVVKAQGFANGPLQEFILLKVGKLEASKVIKKIKALSFPVLVPPPMELKRQEYLYHNIRPFVRDEFKDTTCPRPTYSDSTKKFRQKPRRNRAETLRKPHLRGKPRETARFPRFFLVCLRMLIGWSCHILLRLFSGSSQPISLRPIPASEQPISHPSPNANSHRAPILLKK
jgi:hypothetical protein